MVATRRAYDRSKQLESCSTMRCPRSVKTGRWQQLAEARQLAARLVSPRINPALSGAIPLGAIPRGAGIGMIPLPAKTGIGECVQGQVLLWKRGKFGLKRGNWFFS